VWETYNEINNVRKEEWLKYYNNVQTNYNENKFILHTHNQ